MAVTLNASASSGLIQTADTSTVLQLQTNGTTALTVDSTANVGIGTTSPGSILDVQSSAPIIRNTATTGTNQVAIRQGNTGGYFYTGIDTSAGGYLTGAAYAGFHWMSGAYPMIFATNNSERLRIDSSGNVGIGTTSPGQRLDVQAAKCTPNFQSTTGTNPVYHVINNTGGTLYIGKDGSGGTDFGTGAYSSAIWSTAAYPLVFGTNSAERMRIDSSGRLLVGTTSVSIGTNLEVVNTGGAAAAFVTSQVGDYTVFSHNKATSGTNSFISFGTEATFTARGSITYNRGGGLTAYNTTSDYRAKTVNGLIENALAKVTALKPSTGRMNDAEYDIDFFVAHELQEVVPSAVTGEKDAVNEDGTPNYQMVDKSALIPLLTAAIQELKQIVDAQAATLATQAAEIAALKTKVGG